MTDPRVTGAVRYSQDVAMEGMIHARLLRSPVAHARVVGVDASEVPEGIIVLLPQDVRDLGGYGPQIKDQEVFPQERVRYAGDVVAAVAAETADEAEIAVGLIDVEYEELPAVFDEVESASEEAPLVHETINISKNDAAYFGIRPQQGTNICHRFRLRHGDVEAGFVEADAVVEETYHTAGATHAPMEPHAAGARRDGTLVASESECWANTGAYADCGPGVAQKMGFAAPGPYRIVNVRVDSRAVYTNLPPNGAFRGYGQMQSTWARERTMDLLAEKLDFDPLDLRMKNILEDGDTYCTGETMHDVHFKELLQNAADAVCWSEGRAGKGLCVMLKGMQTPSRASIAVEDNWDGTYTVLCATAEMGQGAKKVMRMMAAELLAVDVEKVSCPDPDTDIVPYDTRTTSSRSTHMMNRALKVAVADLKENGKRGYGEVVDEGGLDPDTGQGVASSHWHQGAAAAEVEVDEETGKFSVIRLHAPIYAGRVINRPAAELQNEGSMIMGLGTALFESNEFADGQITNANLSDYNIPAMDDMPDTLSHELVEREGGEVQGLGETALPPVPPAIGNALYSRGIHVTELPISAESVLEAVDAREGRGDAWAKAGSEPVSTDGRNDSPGERVFASATAPEPTMPVSGSAGLSDQGRLASVRFLLASPSALLLLGTLGMGLLAIALYRLLHRRGEAEKKARPGHRY